jgi:hypothetical protein
MKRLLVVLLAVLVSAPAHADRGGRRYESEFRGSMSWEGGWFFPALVGGAIFLDLARRNTYEQPETVYVSPAPDYIPRAAPAPVWYFCPTADAYYPYVESCPSGWQAVPATPPVTSATSGASENYAE